MKLKDGHTDVASMRRLCKTIIEDCKEISSALPEQEAALPTWLTNKIYNYGSSEKPDKIISQAIKKEVSVLPLINYLENKFDNIYN